MLDDEKRVISIIADKDAVRIDRFLCDTLNDISRSYIASLLQDEKVFVNSKSVKKNYKIKSGDEIVIDMPEPLVADIEPQNIPIDVVYEDDDLIVINKPQGMVVHPAPGNYNNTLVNALLWHKKDELSAINGVVRPGIVHRIDKDTAGLLVVAKNNESHLALAEQLKEKKANRRYIALVLGNIKENGTVNKPLARSLKDRKKIAVVPDGREAVTHYRPLIHYDGYTLVECVLETGRTHQIRVHMSHIGHPIAGDKVYGSKKDKIKLDGQFLFAKTLGFNHPKTGKYVEFSASLPVEFENILNTLKKI